jgi:hypothetical protein
MLKTIAIALVVAAVLVFALYSKRDVNFSMKFLGADMRLETKGEPGRAAATNQP